MEMKFRLKWNLCKPSYELFFFVTAPWRQASGWNVFNFRKQEYDWNLLEHLYAAHVCSRLCLLLCNKRGQSILSQWKVWTKKETKVKLTDRWGSNRFKVNLRSLSPPFSYCLWKTLLPLADPPFLYIYIFFSIYSHTFPVEVILKTRFAPIKLKLYSRSCGCLIESDIDTITTDKLD